METKYKLGEEVEVHFIGKITEMALEREEIFYTVDSIGAYAKRIKESQLVPLFILPDEKNNA